MYNFVIGLYALIVRLISPFHKKARLMVHGHKEVYEILKSQIDTDAKYVWLHAASLGEFEQGRPIVEQIKANHPDYKILLTFFSPSGYEVRKNYELADVVCYLPFDKKRNVRRFIKLAKPSIAIFIKYEFWYNYVNTLAQNNIPVYLVSSIFRRDQLFFNKIIGAYTRRILKRYTKICVQDENSKELLSTIKVNNVEVCGDTRFDRVIDIKTKTQNIPLVDVFTKDTFGVKLPTLVVGSSWPKDEDVFIPYFNHKPGLKLIIAPHEIHDSHLVYIESLLKRPSIRYSEATIENVANYDCLIIDTFGLLSSIYKYGEIAYVGGGFGVGIHNILEAAVYNIPVIFGPNFKKFREAHQLIEAGGAYSIHDNEAFRGLMEEFLQYPEVLAMAGKNAGDYVRSNSGVVAKVMSILEL